MTAIRNTFKVYERLKKEQHIKTLFQKGKAFSVFPLRFIYTISTRPLVTASPVQIGFSVPKKKFRHSVDRHRVRRLMVEAWRLNKSTFYPFVAAERQYQLFVIHTNTALPDFETIILAMQKGIAQLNKIEQTTQNTEPNPKTQ